jgi:hypothetical protein
MTNQIEGGNKSLSIDEMVELGNKIYDELQKDKNIEAINGGQYIAIDVASKKYFIAESRDGAMQAGSIELPKVVFFVRRIGKIDTIACHRPYFRKERATHARFL